MPKDQRFAPLKPLSRLIGYQEAWGFFKANELSNVCPAPPGFYEENTSIIRKYFDTTSNIPNDIRMMLGMPDETDSSCPREISLHNHLGFSLCDTDEEE